MEKSEYQAVKALSDKVWTKTMIQAPQNWTPKNCERIAETIGQSIGENIITGKSIHRFVNLKETDSLDLIRSKDILAHFVAEKPLKPGEELDKTLFETLVKEYETEKNPFHIYEGEYQIFYKSIKNKDLGKIQNDAFVQVMQNGKATFRCLDEYFEGKVELKNGHLFFLFENSAETFFLVVKVGLTKGQRYLSHLAGIFTAVSDKEYIPYSSLVVLVKGNDNHSIDYKRIKTVFEYVENRHHINVDLNTQTLLDVDLDVENALEGIEPEANKNASRLKGCWYVYLKDLNEEKFYRGKLEIQSVNKVRYSGRWISYENGSVLLKGEDLYIYLDGRKHALITARLKYTDWHKLEQIEGAYATINANHNKPSFGKIIIVKNMDSDFSTMTPMEILPDSSEYTDLDRAGIISKLQKEKSA